MLFIISLLIQFFTVWAIFFFGLSRNTGAITTIIVAIATAFISPWSLIFGIPLILISLIVVIEPLSIAKTNRFDQTYKEYFVKQIADFCLQAVKTKKN